MSPVTSLIETIRAADAAVRELLAWPIDFELERREHVEDVRLASGATLEAFAGDGSGGTFFFVGDGGEERPVLYADSEGRATVLADGLPELVRLFLAVPWWRDISDLDDDEAHEGAAEDFDEEEPDFEDDRDDVARALGLEVPSAAAAIARLRTVVRDLGPGVELRGTAEDSPYKPVFRGA